MQIAKESKPNDRQLLLKNSALYMAASFIAQLFGVVRSVILPVLFIPAQLGTWNLMGVIMGYGSNSDFGILQAMSKSIPTLRGQGNLSQVQIIVNSAFWMNMLLAGTVGIVLCLWAWLAGVEYQRALQITAVMIFLSAIFNYLFCLLRSDNRFSLASQGVVSLGILSTLLIVLFAYGCNDPLIGALIGLSLAQMIVIAYWLWKGKYRFAIQLHLKAVWNLLLMGFPLITISLLSSLLLSVDRWIIAAKLSGAMLGYYALCIMVSGVTALVPNSISSVLYPKMLERYGASGNTRSLHGLFSGPMRAMGALMSVLIGSGILVVPFLIRSFVPKYVNSITPLCILLGATYFYSNLAIPWATLVCIDKTKYILRIQMVLIPLAFLLDSFSIYMGWGVIGVALSTSIIYFIFGCACTFFAASYVFEKQSDILRFFIEIIGVFLMMVAALVLSLSIIPEGETLRMSSIFITLRLSLFGFLLFPALYWFNRNGELAAVIREVLISLKVLPASATLIKS